MAAEAASPEPAQRVGRAVPAGGGAVTAGHPRQARRLLMALTQGAFAGRAPIVSVVGDAILPSGHWRQLFLIALARKTGGLMTPVSATREVNDV